MVSSEHNGGTQLWCPVCGRIEDVMVPEAGVIEAIERLAQQSGRVEPLQTEAQLLGELYSVIDRFRGRATIAQTVGALALIQHEICHSTDEINEKGATG
jgi:uncharacterized protein (DUF2342 family)